MRIVFVHNTLDTTWHRTEWRPEHAVPMRKALCGALADTLSQSDTQESWAHVWARAVMPAGTFCSGCDELAMRIDSPEQASTNWTASRSTVDKLLASVFGSDEP